MNLKKLLLLFVKNRQNNPPKTLDFSQIQSVLIRPLGNAIGDAAVHTAHINQLKTTFPFLKIGVLVTAQNRVVFESSQLVDEMIEKNIINYIKNNKKWDLLLDFENNFNSSSLFADSNLNPKYIAIFRKYNKKYYNFDSVKNYDFHFPQKDNERLSHYLKNSSINSNYSLPEPYSILHTKKESDENISKLWRKNKFKLLLCPQGSKRQIPEKELAEFLTKSIPEKQKSKIDIILSFTPEAQDYHQNLIKYCPNLSIKLSPKTDLVDYFSLIHSADFVIAVDGGSLHLACAFKKPLVSFFADSQPNLGTWEPLVYPNIPHFKVLTRNNVGTNSNLTQDFDMDQAIYWMKDYFESV